MSDAKTALEGVALQTITINAATPDLTAAIFREISERVMAAIPPDAYDKVAAEFSQHHKLLCEHREGWGDSAKTVRLFNPVAVMGDQLAKAAKGQIEAAVSALTSRPEFIKAVADVVEVVIAEQMTKIPQIVAEHFASRVCLAFGAKDPCSTALQEEELQSMRAAVNNLVNIYRQERGIDITRPR